MTPFAREGDVIVATFEPAETEILVQLADDVQQLLADAAEAEPDSTRSRAIDRLLPAAYGDGGDDDAEFRRFTSEGLVERKIGNAQSVIDTLQGAKVAATPVRLNAAAVQAWLRCLTDIRLSIAAGLGIDGDDDESSLAGSDRYLFDVYRWLAFVQESLLDALEADFS
ncbi:DUF2017 family protein [Agreia sp. VKM Ac-1783]|uniref:DUF2017 family protein n=1 Tax=Agreia sp. VKM Ac-1783 TaxID=1938889 RepID=UPI000A2ABB81|nr:DUF2017 family protein [Agreia sp. VKM Ac-1783]SMQ68211.1 protein of unknown function [Agreia sp. VKM Ac-1783]